MILQLRTAAAAETADYHDTTIFCFSHTCILSLTYISRLGEHGHEQQAAIRFLVEVAEAFAFIFGFAGLH